MEKIGKIVASLALMLAVMAYTVYNYLNARIDMAMFLVSMAIMGIPMFNMINILIQQWKNKD